MPSFASMSWRISSVQGSAPKAPILSLNSSRGSPESRMASARYSAYDGVQHSTVAPKSCISVICFSVFPLDIGITDAPMFSAPACAPSPPVNSP